MKRIYKKISACLLVVLLGVGFNAHAADESLKRDPNRVPVMGAVTNDADQEVRNLKVDPITGNLLVSDSGSSYETVTSLDAFNTVGVGVPVTVAGAKDVFMIVSCTTVCNDQLKFQASWRKTPLLTQGDFLGSAGTLDDPWIYVDAIEMNQTDTRIDGDTGVNINSDVARVFMLNTDGAVQVVPRVTNHVSGDITVKVTYFNR